MHSATTGLPRKPQCDHHTEPLRPDRQPNLNLYILFTLSSPIRPAAVLRPLQPLQPLQPLRPLRPPPPPPPRQRDPLSVCWPVCLCHIRSLQVQPACGCRYRCRCGCRTIKAYANEAAAWCMYCILVITFSASGLVIVYRSKAAPAEWSGVVFFFFLSSLPPFPLTLPSPRETTRTYHREFAQPPWQQQSMLRVSQSVTHSQTESALRPSCPICLIFFIFFSANVPPVPSQNRWGQ